MSIIITNRKFILKSPDEIVKDTIEDIIKNKDVEVDFEPRSIINHPTIARPIINKPKLEKTPVIKTKKYFIPKFYI